jgi:cytochrome c551/c552
MKRLLTLVLIAALLIPAAAASAEVVTNKSGCISHHQRAHLPDRLVGRRYGQRLGEQWLAAGNR